MLNRGLGVPLYWAAYNPQFYLVLRGKVLSLVEQNYEDFSNFYDNLQGAVYGSQLSVLDGNMFREVVDYKVAEHNQRRVLTRQDAEVKEQHIL